MATTTKRQSNPPQRQASESRLVRLASRHLADLFLVVGAAGIVIGARQAYEPMGWIAGGILLGAFAWLWARKYE